MTDDKEKTAYFDALTARIDGLLSQSLNQPNRIYVLLNSDTDQPEMYNGKCALQSDGNVIADGLELEQAEHIVRVYNSHSDLVIALEYCLDYFSGKIATLNTTSLEKAISQAKGES